MNFSFPLILASNSPRRQELLRLAGIPFSVRVKPTDEHFPPDMPADEVARYLAEQKAEAFRDELQDELVITADTTVVLGDEVLNKPADEQEAYAMLRRLSGTRHKVITGVSLLSRSYTKSFDDCTSVYFRPLEDEEIWQYIRQYKPFDKAGSYGIQEWIGMVGIERIEGSYYNVMGLPVEKLYQHLKKLAL
ncbi:Maf family protein [Cesiribacter andamanensis]|uniref:dTTP/UTP pyrophosphatase n=1 Tax=Cesiribacter andamanensis AMV16 TaxID=1279009 RepID=M7N6F9_9BACT|nr:Maf family protein [Cesiribacter andamanensis]EMR02801.1 Septum formation protein Maf [Cesiribacter andamanensis AMV16]